jgi:hypothetical protein
MFAFDPKLEKIGQVGSDPPSVGSDPPSWKDLNASLPKLSIA